MTRTALEAVVAGVGAIAVAGACGWFSYTVAVRLVGDASASVRASACVVVASWSLVASFTLLTAAGAFRREIAVPLWCVVAAATHLRMGGASIVAARIDLSRARAGLRGLWSSQLRWLLVAALAMVGIYALRGLVAPPLGWDALTYHLPKAARWVQTGRFWSPQIGPDAWSYYEYFPHAAEVIWAWALLLDHGDALLAPAGLLVWSWCLLATYTASRALGASTRRAAGAALLLGVTPAVLKFVNSAYVDNTLLASLLLGFCFVQRVQRTRAGGDAVLAAAALGLAAGVKWTGAPIAAIGILLAIVPLIQRSESWSRGVWKIAACAAAASIALPGYLRAWWWTGSPVYPLSFSIAGHTWLAGNAELDALQRAAFPTSVRAWANVLGALFVPQTYNLGLGPCGALLVPFGLAGLWQLARRPDQRRAAVWLALCIALVALPVLSQPTSWSIWRLVSARFVTPCFAVLVIAAAVLPGRATDVVFAIAILGALALDVPGGVGPAEARGAALLLAWLGVLFVAARVTLRLVDSGRRVPWAAASLIWLIAASVAVHAVRAGCRYAVYEEAGAQRSFDPHPLLYAFGWRVWDALDDGSRHRLAVTAGWEPPGHNAYVYPLFGSKLQNDVLYVPPTQDGAPLDYGMESDPAARASFAAWIERLEQQRIDTVVTLAPAPPVEIAWIRAHPERFQTLSCSSNGKICAHRFLGQRTAR